MDTAALWSRDGLSILLLFFLFVLLLLPPPCPRSSKRSQRSNSNIESSQNTDPTDTDSTQNSKDITNNNQNVKTRLSANNNTNNSSNKTNNNKSNELSTQSSNNHRPQVPDTPTNSKNSAKKKKDASKRASSITKNQHSNRTSSNHTTPEDRMLSTLYDTEMSSNNIQKIHKSSKTTMKVDKLSIDISEETISSSQYQTDIIKPTQDLDETPHPTRIDQLPIQTTPIDIIDIVEPLESLPVEPPTTTTTTMPQQEQQTSTSPPPQDNIEIQDQPQVQEVSNNNHDNTQQDLSIQLAVCQAELQMCRAELQHLKELLSLQQTSHTNQLSLILKTFSTLSEAQHYYQAPPVYSAHPQF